MATKGLLVNFFEQSTALQALPAGAALGIPPAEGFLVANPPVSDERIDQYGTKNESLSIVVVGRAPFLQELKDVCVLRNFQTLKILAP